MEYLDSDGKTPIGFDVELSKTLAAKLGLQVKFIDTAWDGTFAAVTSDKYDVIASALTVTKERTHAHNFTKPYIGNAQSLVLLKGSSITARRQVEVFGSRSSAGRGWCEPACRKVRVGWLIGICGRFRVRGTISFK